jgi:hypothetical protein
MEENPYKAPIATRRRRCRFTWFDDLALAVTAIFVLAGVVIALFGPFVNDLVPSFPASR